MTNKKITRIVLFVLPLLFIFLSAKTNNSLPVTKEELAIESKTKKDISKWIVKGSSIEVINGRRPYNLDGREINTKHFVVRITTPENPFGPHKHEQYELWFILEGKGKVFLDGKEYDVEKNDLIILDPWVEHGLITSGKLTWICLG